MPIGAAAAIAAIGGGILILSRQKKDPDPAPSDAAFANESAKPATVTQEYANDHGGLQPGQTMTVAQDDGSSATVTHNPDGTITVINPDGSTETTDGSEVEMLSEPSVMTAPGPISGAVASVGAAVNAASIGKPNPYRSKRAIATRTRDKRIRDAMNRGLGIRI